MLDPRVQSALDKGKPMICPCCEQRVQRYRRRIHRSMLRCLRHIASCPAGVSAKDLEGATSVTCRDYPTLRNFGLIQQDASTKFWHATSDGQDFLAGLGTLPLYVYIYDNKVLGFSEKHVSVSDCQAAFDKADLTRRSKTRPKLLAA